MSLPTPRSPLHRYLLRSNDRRACIMNTVHGVFFFSFLRLKLLFSMRVDVLGGKYIAYVVHILGGKRILYIFETIENKGTEAIATTITII